MPKEHEQREIQGATPANTSHPPGDLPPITHENFSRKFTYGTFIKEYAGTFSQNFETFCNDRGIKHKSRESLPVNADELYALMFAEIFNENLRNNIKQAFEKSVLLTAETEAIFSHTWLLMVRDLVNRLIGSNEMINTLSTFMMRINQLSDILSAVYFETSRVVTMSHPDINPDTPAYQDILQIFKKHINDEASGERKYELKVHTYYRAIPVELNAEVLSVDAESVTFRVHPYEAVALSKFGMALITSSLSKTVFRAYASRIDINQRSARFTHFILHNRPLENRAHIRIEPKTLIKARIIHDSGDISGVLCDISEVDASVYVRNLDIEKYQAGMPVHFIVSLPASFEKGFIIINTTGKITKIYKRIQGDLQAHKLIICMEDNQKIKDKLSHFVSQRQLEIMKELKTLSEDID